MKLRVFVASCVAALLMVAAAPSIAADLKMSVKAPPVVAPPPMTWTGCYVGGNVGGGWGRDDYQDPLAVPPAPLFLGGHDVNSVVGGGQIGCDYQFVQSWVIGFQGMLDAADLRGTHLNPAGDFLSTRIPWFGTATVRLGYAVTPSLLLYVKGGGVWKRERENIVDAVTLLPEGAARVTRSGFIGGGGLEWMFAPRWSVFVEGAYLGFGRSTVNYVNFEIPPVPPVFPLNIRENIWYAMVGVNFRFWTGS